MIYLDNGATTYRKPPSVRQAVNKWLECGNAGRGSHSLSLAASELIYKTREKVLQLFSADNHSVVFTNNATSALNYAIQGIATEAARIITTDFEHNSVRRPLLYLQKERRCKIEKLETAREDILLRQLSEYLQHGADAVVCIHKSNVTGRRIPIDKIGLLCKKYDVPFIVDASQSAGNTRINIKSDNIGILCCAGHKGLMGPQGTGLMVVSDDIKLKPVTYGGTGSNSFDEDMPAIYPDSHEAGTLPCALIAGLGAGIDYVRFVGEDVIEEKEKKLFSLCRDMLAGRHIKIYDEELKGANLLFNLEGKGAEEVAHMLDRVGICVRSGFHCAPDAHNALGTGESGAVRVSFSCFTTEKEVYTFCRELLRIAK